MTTNLDRPLGDIIKEGARRGGGRGGGRGRGRGGSRGGSMRGGGGFRGGARGGSGRGGFRASFRGGAGSFRARGAANGAGPIRRDRGGFRQATPYQRPPPRQQVGGGLAAGSRIMLTNLDPQLTEDDCLEIFQNVGPVSRAVIHYNRDGSSQGTAEVHFANKNDALRAVDEYDAAQIDGRPMYVKVIANKAPTVVQRAPAPIVQQSVQFPAFRGKPNGVPRGAGGGSRGARGAAARGGPLRRGGAPRGARGGSRGQSRGAARGAARGGARGGRGGRGRENKPTPTAAASDAEMDQYYSHGAATETDLIAAGQPANPAIAPKQ